MRRWLHETVRIQLIMSDRLTSEIRETLEYLADIGYDEIYLSAPSTVDDSAGQPRGSETRLRPETAPSGSELSRPSSEASPPEASPPETEPSSERPLVASPITRPSPPASVPVAPPPVTAAAAPTPSSSSPLASSSSSPSDPPVSVADRAAALELLAGEASACVACRLSKGRQSVVFGSGYSDARLMLIGEGPGAEEDRQGLPFVGPAGELLTKILKAIELERSQVYIANVVKCRPPRNRDPEQDEVVACRGFLERQIELIQPQLIVALGRVAAQALLGTSESLGRLRGRWHSVLGIPTRATYHPAALLRYTKYKRPTWEDMQLVRDRLRELS